MAFSDTVTQYKADEQRILAAANGIPLNPGDSFKIDLVTDHPIDDLGIFNIDNFDFGLGAIVKNVRAQSSSLLIGQQEPNHTPEMGDAQLSIWADYQPNEAGILNPEVLQAVYQILRALALLGISYAVTKITTFATSPGGGEKITTGVKDAASSVSSASLSVFLPILLILIVIAYMTHHTG